MKLNKLSYNLKVEIENVEANNEKDKKEKDNMREYSYFKSILNNIDYTKLTDINKHFKIWSKKIKN